MPYDRLHKGRSEVFRGDTAFHTYGVEWDQNAITWDIDGIPFFVSNDAAFPGVTIPVPDAVNLKINTACVLYYTCPPRASATLTTPNSTLRASATLNQQDRMVDPRREADRVSQ